MLIGNSNIFGKNQFVKFIWRLSKNQSFSIAFMERRLNYAVSVQQKVVIVVLLNRRYIGLDLHRNGFLN